MFIKRKKLKKWYYAYLVETYWDKDKRKVRQRVLKYLGKFEENNKIIEFKLESCAICKSTEKLTIDHIVPLSKGGTHDLLNLQCLCIKCNQKKGSKG